MQIDIEQHLIRANAVAGMGERALSLMRRLRWRRYPGEALVGAARVVPFQRAGSMRTEPALSVNVRPVWVVSCPRAAR